MRFLLDTNVLIKLEPTAHDAIEEGADIAARLSQLLTGGEHAALVHPAIEHDIARDDDPDRQAINRFLFVEKFRSLRHPPSSAALEATLGSPTFASNDWVDLQLIATVQANAVDYVVTEDSGLIRKLRRIGLGDRALRLAQAVQTLDDLYEHDVAPPPVVAARPMYSLDRQDPIWDSFRTEYEEFDDWYERVCRDERPAWYVEGDDGYQGVCIVKTENDRPHGLEGKVLKICSFKVSESARGSKFGELLLKTVFRHANENRCDTIYVEVFPHHDNLLTTFGRFTSTTSRLPERKLSRGCV